MMSDIASPIASIRRRLLRNDALTRSSFPAPRFCATSTEVAALPLSPNELAKPSMRVVAVYAEIMSVPPVLTAPCTSSLPIYRLDWCSAVTKLKCAV